MVPFTRAACSMAAVLILASCAISPSYGSEIEKKLLLESSTQWSRIEYSGETYVGFEEGFEAKACYLLVFQDYESANQSALTNSFTSNAYAAWIGSDIKTGKGIIVQAVSDIEDCAKSIKKIFGWATLVWNGPNMLSGGGPIDFCTNDKVRNLGLGFAQAKTNCENEFRKKGLPISGE